jgi:hypothetical protein
MMYNPAGLPNSGGASFWYGQRNEHIYGLEGRRYTSFNATCHTSIVDAGLFYNKWTYGELPVTTEQQPDGTGKTVNLYECSYGIGISKRLGEFGAGFSIKTLDISGMFPNLSSSFITSASRPVLVDFGVLYSHDFSIKNERPTQQINLGVSIQNLGEHIEVTDKPTNGVLPPGSYYRINNTIEPHQYLRIGFAYTFESSHESEAKLSPFHFMLTGQYGNWVNKKSSSYRDFWGFGMEGIVYEIVAFRVGGYDRNETTLLRYGGGIHFPFRIIATDIPWSLAFDYAAIKLDHYTGDRSTLHTFSLGIQYEAELL